MQGVELSLERSAIDIDERIGSEESKLCVIEMSGKNRKGCSYSQLKCSICWFI